MAIAIVAVMPGSAPKTMPTATPMKLIIKYVMENVIAPYSFTEA